MRLVILRPEPGSSATLARARELGLDAVAVPLFEVEPVPWEAPDLAVFNGLLLTSANAVRLAGEQLRDLRGLKTYAVGEATASVARDAGFDIAATGEAGVDRLLGSIEPDLKLLHLCGEDRREPQGAKQEITTVAVYRAKPLDAAGLGDMRNVVALIHSARAGRRFAELVKDRGTTSIAAISEAARHAVGDGWKTVAVANSPTDDALLALAASLCDKPDPK
jgi:uroporphyrinogen-III synthase